MVLDPFPKSLGWNVHPAEDYVTGVLPGFRPAREDGDILVARCFQPGGKGRGEASAVVSDTNTHGLSRQKGVSTGLSMYHAEWYSPEQVVRAEFTVLARID